MEKKACIVDIKKNCHLVSARKDERMNFFLNIFTQELFNRIYVGKYTINMFFMTHGLGIYIRILPRAIARGTI
jgi:hypothetical protein